MKNMTVSKHWVTGRYNTHTLRLSQDIVISIEWTRGTFRGTFLGAVVESRDLVACKVAIEVEANLIIDRIKVRLNTDRVEARPDQVA